MRQFRSGSAVFFYRIFKCKISFNNAYLDHFGGVPWNTLPNHFYVTNTWVNLSVESKELNRQTRFLHSILTIFLGRWQWSSFLLFYCIVYLDGYTSNILKAKDIQDWRHHFNCILHLCPFMEIYCSEIRHPMKHVALIHVWGPIKRNWEEQWQIQQWTD